MSTEKKHRGSTRSPKKTEEALRGPLFVDAEPSTPTTSEWERMSPFGSFVLVNDAGHEHRFPLYSYALILPEGRDPHGSLHLRDYWVGKIKEIRSRNGDPSQVWVRTQWLLSIKDVLPLTRTNATLFGGMERLLSNQYDFVHTSCFADSAHVVPYVESDPEPPAISDETFYYRYVFDVGTRKVEPKPTAACFCGVPYNADETGAMHFCPRERCQKEYHAECLRQAGSIEKNRRDLHSLHLQRQLQFERALPESLDSKKMAELRDTEAIPEPGSRTQISNASVDPSCQQVVRQEQPGTAMYHVDRHCEIPADLLALARSPMVKGIGTNLPYEWSCVTGNYAVVVRARRMVKQVVEDGQRLLENWLSMLEIPDASYGEEGQDVGEGVENFDVKNWFVSDENLFLCPCCKRAI